jgi:hypothetical protein
MSAEDILKDSSLVAIITGILGLIILFVSVPLGVLLIGLVGLFFGVTAYLKDRNDMVALIATILGVVVIAAAIFKWL